MRNLRNRVSALALAVVMASGLGSMFSTNVSAFDGTFTPPSNEQICAALAQAEAGLAYVNNAILKALLQQYIDRAQTFYHCS
jgi:hypothetical protein